MSAIASPASSSNLSAVAQFLANSVSTAAAATPQTSPSSSETPAAASSNLSDSLDLSDHAKATLARAQQDQIAADKLQAFLQSARDSKGAGNSSSPSQGSNQSSNQAPNNVTKAFDQLTGQTPPQGQQGSVLAPGQSFNDFIETQFATLKANAKLPDGTIGNYSETFNDISFTPTTPEAIDNWYQTNGQAAIQTAQDIAQFAPGSPQAINAAIYAQAVENHALTFLNAFDIPGLDFHNSLTIDGGEHGGQNNWSATYNHDAAILHDPTTSYAISSGGTVITWKNPQAADITASI
jgi:hypothetical protein